MASTFTLSAVARWLKIVEDSGSPNYRVNQYYYDVPVYISHAPGQKLILTDIDKSGTTATATCSSTAALKTGDYVTIYGAAEPVLNGLFAITVTSPTQFTYTTTTGTVTNDSGVALPDGKLILKDAITQTKTIEIDAKLTSYGSIAALIAQIEYLMALINSGVTSGNIDTKATSGTGATYVQLNTKVCTTIRILNNTGTALDVKVGSGGTAFSVPDGTEYDVFPVANATDVYIRRTDQSNTPVTVYYKWEL